MRRSELSGLEDELLKLAIANSIALISKKLREARWAGQINTYINALDETYKEQEIMSHIPQNLIDYMVKNCAKGNDFNVYKFNNSKQIDTFKKAIEETDSLTLDEKFEIKNMFSLLDNQNERITENIQNCWKYDPEAVKYIESNGGINSPKLDHEYLKSHIIPNDKIKVGEELASTFNVLGKYMDCEVDRKLYQRASKELASKEWLKDVKRGNSFKKITELLYEKTATKEEKIEISKHTNDCIKDKNGRTVSLLDKSPNEKEKYSVFATTARAKAEEATAAHDFVQKMNQSCKGKLSEMKSHVFSNFGITFTAAQMCGEKGTVQDYKIKDTIYGLVRPYLNASAVISTIESPEYVKEQESLFKKAFPEFKEKLFKGEIDESLLQNVNCKVKPNLNALKTLNEELQNSIKDISKENATDEEKNLLKCAKHFSNFVKALSVEDTYDEKIERSAQYKSRQRNNKIESEIKENRKSTVSEEKVKETIEPKTLTPAEKYVNNLSNGLASYYKDEVLKYEEKIKNAMKGVDNPSIVERAKENIVNYKTEMSARAEEDLNLIKSLANEVNIENIKFADFSEHSTLEALDAICKNPDRSVEDLQKLYKDLESLPSEKGFDKDEKIKVLDQKLQQYNRGVINREEKVIETPNQRIIETTELIRERTIN